MNLHKNKNMTRRRFVTNMAGTAFCFSCLPLNALAASVLPLNPDAEKNNRVKLSGTGKLHLAAACGTYCGACPAYINKHGEREENFPSGSINSNIDWLVNYMKNSSCDGCLSGGLLAGHCENCEIRTCKKHTQDNPRCSNCDFLNCSLIKDLIDQGDYPHRQEYYPNLEKIREMGVEDWIEYEEARWLCPRCGQTMNWYDTRCTKCGAPRSWRLFALSENGDNPRGDIDDNGIVELPDSILSLQICANTDMDTKISLTREANNDGKIGLEEVIYILRRISGL